MSDCILGGKVISDIAGIRVTESNRYHAKMPMLDVPGGALNFEVRGEGPPVLLIHGTGGTHTTWSDSFDRLAEQHRTIAYDRRGYGRSNRSRTVDYGVHARDAAALLDHLDARPATVVGHSSGGVVALGLALAEPSAVESLVLLEPPLHLRLHPTLGTLSASLKCQKLALQGRDREAALVFFRWATSSSAGGNSFDNLSEDLREEGFAQSATVTAEVARLTRRPGTGEHLRRRQISSLTCPISFLYGELSNPALRNAARRFAKWQPAARMVEIPGATHLLHHEAPDRLVREVSERNRRPAAKPMQM
jgi:pimeloyl-ACP methyl ester carboxylesterase